MKKKRKITARVEKNLKKTKNVTSSQEAVHFRKIDKINSENNTLNNLEKTIRQQSNELEIKSGQLKQGINREKIAEEEIHIRTKAMEATSDGIFIIDAKKSEFPVIYTNSAFQSLTGYIKSEVIGQNYFLLFGADSDLRIVDEIKSTLLQGRYYQGEVFHLRKNGSKFWSLLRIGPVRDTNGVVTHYVGIQTDMTLIKQRDLEISEQREDLLHVTRVGKLAEFVSSLAHEISQPLTAILSYAQAAQRMLADREPEVQEIMQYIINDDQRAAEVIRRLRLLLKKSKPTLEILDVNALINDTVALIMTHITMRKIVLNYELDLSLPMIQGDRIQLQQVILNLISNSLEAMESGCTVCELLIRTSRKDTNTVLVEVRDSGSGIAESDLSRLFTHFFTSKVNGLGMGLPISRSIVEAHGGRLDAQNNSDRGATFYFTLPIYAKETL